MDADFSFDGRSWKYRNIPMWMAPLAMPTIYIHQPITSPQVCQVIDEVMECARSRDVTYEFEEPLKVRHVLVNLISQGYIKQTEVLNPLIFIYNNHVSQQIILSVEELKQAFEQSNIRFVVLPILITEQKDLMKGDASAHSNAIIFDKASNDAYFFEPQAKTPITKNLINFLHTFVTDVLGYKWSENVSSCPRGPQGFDRAPVRKDDLPGYCASWTILWTVLKLCSPELTSAELNVQLLTKGKEVGLRKLVRCFTSWVKKWDTPDYIS